MGPRNTNRQGCFLQIPPGRKSHHSTSRAGAEKPCRDLLNHPRSRSLVLRVEGWKIKNLGGWKKAKKQKKYGKLLKYYLTIDLVDCCWLLLIQHRHDYSDYSDANGSFVFKFMSLTSGSQTHPKQRVSPLNPKEPVNLAYGYQSQTKDP